MNYLFSNTKNWESDIRQVRIEASDEDPSGFRAVFFLTEEEQKSISFSVGASKLAQRAKSLALAGYNTPMTKKALAMLEGNAACMA